MSGEPEAETSATKRRIEFEYSLSLSAILRHYRLSLLVTTYQAGKLVVIGTREGQRGTPSVLPEPRQPDGRRRPARVG